MTEAVHVGINKHASPVQGQNAYRMHGEDLMILTYHVPPFANIFCNLFQRVFQRYRNDNIFILAPTS